MKKLLLISSFALILCSCASNKEVQKRFDVNWAYEQSQEAQIKQNREYIKLLEQRIEELENENRDNL